MPERLALVSMLVDNYDNAKAWFERTLGFTCIEDTPLSEVKCWIVMRPAGSEKGADVLLAKAAKPEQAAMIGRQGGGRVWLFLETDDFEARYAAMQQAGQQGVKFWEEPRKEAYGTVVQFEDLWGNRWDLLQRAKQSEGYS